MSQQNNGHWFKFVLYKKAGNTVEAKIVELWARNINTAISKVTKAYPDYGQWFLVQTGWWKVLAGLFTFSKIVKWKK